MEAFRTRFIDNPSCKAAFKLTGACKYSVGYDSMHVVDLNGVTAHALGSLFAESIRGRELGNANIDDGVNILNDKIAEWYDVHGIKNRIRQNDLLTSLYNTINIVDDQCSGNELGTL
jgi:hypothetical protein